MVRAKHSGIAIATRLILIRLSPGEATNAAWAHERRLPMRWRWTIRGLDRDGKVCRVPGLSDSMYPSYSKALVALERHEKAKP